MTSEVDTCRETLANLRVSTRRTGVIKIGGNCGAACEVPDWWDHPWSKTWTNFNWKSLVYKKGLRSLKNRSSPSIVERQISGRKSLTHNTCVDIQTSYIMFLDAWRTLVCVKNCHDTLSVDAYIFLSSLNLRLLQVKADHWTWTEA